jgi:hypothetical protein
VAERKTHRKISRQPASLKPASNRSRRSLGIHPIR